MRFLKFKKDVRALDALCRYFWNLGGYTSIKSALKEDSFWLKKTLTGRALDYLSEKLFSLKYHKS